MIAEREVVAAAVAGDSDAFGSLVERYRQPLFDFLRMRSRNEHDAEELVQEAFLRAWTKLDRYDDRWRFSTWLFTVAARLAVSKGRRARLAIVGNDETLNGVAGSDHDPLQPLQRADERANLWALAREVLSPEQRSALWLRYSEGLEAREVAEVLGRGAATTRVILFRARERLARHLTREEDGLVNIPAVPEATA